eukprot:SM000005S17251  [mRNA]  locus=s5:1040237:1044172:+ [translate_table: standard]
MDLGWLRGPAGVTTAAVAMAATCGLSVLLVYRHLTKYHALKVPIYVVTSFLSLVLKSRTVAYYFTSTREIYEAYVIYNFVSLILAYCDGARNLVRRCTEDKRTLPTAKGYLQGLIGRERETQAVDGEFLRHCMQGVLQFVFLRSFWTAMSVALDLLGLYEGGHETMHIIENYIFNVSVTVAVTALVFFYIIAEPYLTAHNPLPKFLLVKFILFVTFWQGIAIDLAVTYKVLLPPVEHPSKKDRQEFSTALQDYLTCLESLLAAWAMCRFFSPSEYRDQSHPSTPAVEGLQHVVDQTDVVNYTQASFGQEYTHVVQVTGDILEPIKPHLDAISNHLPNIPNSICKVTIGNTEEKAHGEPGEKDKLLDKGQNGIPATSSSAAPPSKLLAADSFRSSQFAEPALQEEEIAEAMSVSGDGSYQHWGGDGHVAGRRKAEEGQNSESEEQHGAQHTPILKVEKEVVTYFPKQVEKVAAGILSDKVEGAAQRAHVTVTMDQGQDTESQCVNGEEAANDVASSSDSESDSTKSYQQYFGDMLQKLKPKVPNLLTRSPDQADV